MSKTVKRPRDIPSRLNTRGRIYSQKDLSTRRKELSNEAKKLKRAGSISHYLIRKYKNVNVRSSPVGSYKKKTVYALFVA